MAEPQQSKYPASIMPGADRDDGAGLAQWLYRPIAFEEPNRLVHPASWVEHIPFAFWLVDALRPSIFVELGTHSGNSYAAFAQAVARLELPTACYAVDTWKGDPHAGEFDESVFTEWREYHDRQFSAFSRLIRSTFSEAVHHFADDSIDLLHIDGYHTLEAVEQDFATWLPKMSSRGIVLLHDINVREDDFGAWRLWRRLEESYPSFAFLHGHGLGVVGVGQGLPKSVSRLLSCESDSPSGVVEVRRFFARLGGHLTLLSEERARNERTVQELREDLRREHAESEQAHGDVEARRLSGRACLDRAISELERRVRDERMRAEQAVREAEARLQDAQLHGEQAARETEVRLRAEHRHLEQTIRELDTEARTSAALVQTFLGKARPRRSWKQRWIDPLSRRGATYREIVSAACTVGISAIGYGPVRVRARAAAQYLKNPRRFVGVSAIAQSGLFDAQYYLAQHPDVVAVGVHPLVHYSLWGAFEGRNPNPLFDPAYYLEHSPDVRRARLEPLAHFLRHGGKEERNPGPFFDTRYYLACNPDVRASGTNPLSHFLQQGWREGRSPLPTFDIEAYVARHEDVRTSGINPLVHYLQTGAADGRDTSQITTASIPAPLRVKLTTRPLLERRRDGRLLVCLTHVPPWPPDAGNSYRLYRLLRHLRRDGFQIVPVIAPLPNESPSQESVQKVADLFSNVIVIERNGEIRYSLSDVPDVLASLDQEVVPRFSALLGEERPLNPRERQLLVTDRTYCHDAVIAAMVRLHSVLGPYVLLVQYVWMSRVLPLLDDRALKVLDTIDVFSTKPAKVLQFGIPDLWLEPEEEARRLRLADLVVAIQDDERRELQRLAPNVRVVTAGVDFDITGSPSVPATDRVLYVGSGNLLNVNGLQDFLRFAWPIIRREVPTAELIVAGGVSQTIGEAVPGVIAAGFVPNLDELYETARVVINPAVAGTGMKIKTVEALSRLRPLVTWPAGVDGLPADVKKVCDVVHDWYDFGCRVASRLRTNQSETYSSAERNLIAHTLSEGRAYGKLTAALRALSEERATKG